MLGSEATSLVASGTPSRVQAGCSGIQVTAWLNLALPGGGTPAHPYRRAVIFVLPTPTSASSLGPVFDWATEVSVSLDHEFGTVYIQHSATAWHRRLTVQTTIEYISVCLSPRRTNFSSFDVLCIHWFTYLHAYVRLNLIGLLRFSNQY